MSRCFPFPPPGYEKKARPDQDATLLIKENLKDKKQKKDKKDKKKEKRDKDKEKSSEKHREKKEKKHKHRDKKEKERDKEKEDKKPSEERKIAGLLDQKSDQRGQTVLPVVETQAGSKLLLDLEKKAGNDSNGTREMQVAERIRVPDHSVQSGKVLERNEGTLADSVQKFKDKREENRIPNGHYVNPNATGLANGFVPNLPVKDQKNIEGSGVLGGKVTEKHKERKDTHKHKDGDRKGDKKAGDKEKKSKSKDKKRKREKEKEKAKENNLSGSTPGKLRENDNNAVDCSTDRGSNLSKESSLSHRSINKRKEPEKGGISNGNEIQSNKLLRPASASNQVFQTEQRIDVSNAALQFGQEATVQRINSNNKNLPSISVVGNGMKSEMRQNVTNIALERQQLLNNHSKTNSRHASSVSSPFGNGENLELGITIQGESARSSANMEKVAVANPAIEKKNVPLQIVENGRKFEYDRFNNLASVERQGDVAKLKFTDKGSHLNGSSVPKLDERASKINGVLELKKPTGGAKCERSAPGPQMDIFEIPGKPPLELKKLTGGAKCERPAPGLHKDIHEVPVKPPLELKKPAGEAKCERPAPGLHKDIREAPVKPPLELKKLTGEAKCEKPAPGPDIFETTVKPPHPDLKYLDEILTIPKPVEWSDADDQTWLFSREVKSANKPVKVEEPKQVWAEAMRIDSADVVALPYVIPF